MMRLPIFKKRTFLLLANKIVIFLLFYGRSTTMR